MSPKQIPIDLNAQLREEPDQTYTIVVEVSGIATVELAHRVSEWLRAAIRDHADMLGELDKPSTRQ